jgi:uncharacterized protein (DUF2236 family)
VTRIRALPARDAELLRRACGRRVAPRDRLFPPESATWRVNREACLLLAGGRALLLQVAHPLVAAGVAAHSRFRDEPLLRLWRTLDLMVTIVFGEAASAITALRAIERVHARVRGVLDEDAGPFRRGTPYSARDPELLLWVHATLVDTALLAYERFVAPLPPRLAGAYYRDSKVVARLFGVPEALIPAGLPEFRRYVRQMFEGDVLAVSAAGREIAAGILHPPLAPGLRHAVESTGLVTTALLPPRLRESYGLSWSPRRQRAFEALARVVRASLPVLPRSVRYLPQSSRGIGPSALAMAVRFARLRAA